MQRALADGQALASPGVPYPSDIPTTIIELQPFRRTQRVEFSVRGAQGPDGAGEAMLTNLNPQINVWFLVTIRWTQSGKSEAYHLENPWPKTQRLSIDADHPSGIRILSDGREIACELWGGQGTMDIAASAAFGVCRTCRSVRDRLYLRNPFPAPIPISNA